MRAISVAPAVLSSILLALALAGCAAMPRSPASGTTPKVIADATTGRAVAGEHRPTETGVGAFFREVGDSVLKGVSWLFHPAPRTYGPPEDAASAGPKAWTRQTGWTGCTANPPHSSQSGWCSSQ